VSIRYHGRAGHTDAIGELIETGPLVRVRTARGEVVAISGGDVVAVRELSHIPVRASQIRALEHAAALAGPGTEWDWHRGWLLRSTGESGPRSSAVPLDISCAVADLPGIVEWYRTRGQTPWLAVAERLLAVRAAGTGQTRIVVADVGSARPPDDVTLAAEPGDSWPGATPVGVLTAVQDGSVVFAAAGRTAVGRGALTTAPDGTRWLGISSVWVAPGHRRSGRARAICAALRHWGAARGADRVYAEVGAEDRAGTEFWAALGFRLHHRRRYLDARRLLAGRAG
jgi:N-acetylglutamate synthase